MIDEIILIGGQLCVVALFGALGAALFRRAFRPSWFFGALLLFVIYDFLLTRAFFTLPFLPPEADWNWMGKSMSLAGMLAVAALPAFGYVQSGITLRQKNGSLWAFAVLGALAAAIFYFAVMGGDGRDDWETIFFQWTMPGLDEEVFYRGVFLLAMNEAFAGRVRVFGAPIGYGGLLTCVLFGLVHGLDYGKGGFEFDAITFLATGGPSLLLLWMREKTGSLVAPILAHNVVNGAFTLF